MRGRSKESALLNPDFRDILSIFNEENVEYLLVGAYALRRFGAPAAQLRERDFNQPGITLQLGVTPRRIDLLTEIDGVTFENAYPNRLSIQVEGVNVPVIGRQDLLMNKKAAGRPQDLVDAAWLESESGERF